LIEKMAATELRLNLPELAINRNPTVTTSPAETERWLTGLPFLNIADTSHLIVNALAELNRTRLNESQRFKLLELYRPSVRHLSAELQKNYLGLALPLPERSRLIAQQARQIQIEMAFGYKRVTLEVTQRGAGRAADKTALATPIQRAIRYLTEVLVKSYELYTPAPAGCWREIHELYGLAEELGLAELAVPDALNEATRHGSISHAYKKALLIALCDPYRLPTRLLEKVQRYLDAHAVQARLGLPSATLQASSEYLICLDDDRANHIPSPERKDVRPERLRVLNTLELARTIHNHLNSLKQEMPPELGGLERDLSLSDLRDLLRRLLVSWGLNPKRAFTRSTARVRELNLAIGIEAIGYFLNGAQDFLLSRSEMGPPPQRTQFSTADGQQYLGFPRPELYTWEVLNESAAGLALRERAVPKESLRIGEIIAVKPAGESGGWNIAVIRWLKTAGAGGIEFGAQRLAPRAEAVAIRAEGGDGQDEGFVAALALPEIKPIGQPPTLITRRGMFKPGRVLLVDDGYRLRRVLAARLVELSNAFEQFQYKDIEP
jgi:hypothetical protein